MPEETTLTPQCIERLRTWIQIKCPCSLEDDELLPGLWAIIEDEVAEAVLKARTSRAAAYDKPSSN